MSSQQDIDDLTLSLFMNKSRYNKYIAKTDPVAHAEREEYLQNVKKFRQQILSITDALIENPEETISSEINEVFAVYSKRVIQHLLQEQSRSLHVDVDVGAREDEDMMFARVEEPRLGRGSFWSGEQVTRRGYRLPDKI
jgi:phosphoketolase